jgi:hypothetical protein
MMHTHFHAKVEENDIYRGRGGCWECCSSTTQVIHLSRLLACPWPWFHYIAGWLYFAHFTLVDY